MTPHTAETGRHRDAGHAAADCAYSEGRRLDRRMEMSRRGLLTALGGATLATVTVGGTRLAFGAGAGTASNVLVTVVLGGGVDGLSLVVPLGDPDYAKNRPGIGVPASACKKVDSLFGLHPALAPLYPLWTSGKFAAVQAVGQESPTRSHFEAMDELERAAPNSSLRTGWLNRTLGLLPASGALEAVALGQYEVPGHLRGPRPSLVSGLLDDVKLSVDTATTPTSLWQKAIGQLHVMARPEVKAPMGNALAAISALSSKVPPVNGTGNYPDNDFGHGLRDVARLIKADVGLQVASVTLGSWDHHVNLGTVSAGLFLDNVKVLAAGLAAFAADLGTAFDRVTVFTLSEFGRRVQQNGNYGVDHGHGGVTLALGGGLNGGAVHGTWPGLSVGKLDMGLDLKVTTDYRSVMAEILTGRMGVSSTKDIFPGFTPQRVGLVKGT
jgi:uncharacterized protein (DUF1501 family)